MKEQISCHTLPLVVINMDVFFIPCVFPSMDKEVSPVGEGTHPSNALEYFLGKIKTINLFPWFPEDDVSNIEEVLYFDSVDSLMLFNMVVEHATPTSSERNIEEVPDSDSVSSLILFGMVVEPATPTSFERKRFRSPLVNAQTRSYNMKVERVTSVCTRD